MRPRLVLKVVAAVFAAIALWYAIRPLYARFVVHAGALILHHGLDGPPPAEMFMEDEGQHYLVSGLTGRDGRPMRHRLRIHEVYWNLILYLVLVLLTPPSTLLRYWWLAALGSLALYATHVAFFVVAVVAQLGRLYLQHGMEIWTPATVNFLGSAMMLYSVVIAAIMPFLLYLPVIVLARTSHRPRATAPRDGAS